MFWHQTVLTTLFSSTIAMLVNRHWTSLYGYNLHIKSHLKTFARKYVEVSLDCKHHPVNAHNEIDISI